MDKNRQQDDTIEVGEVVLVPWLRSLQFEMKQQFPPTKFFFPSTLAQYGTEFRTIAVEAGIARLGMTPRGNDAVAPA